MVATAGQRRQEIGEKKKLCVTHGRKLSSAQMLEVTLFGVGMALHLESDVSSMA